MFRYYTRVSTSKQNLDAQLPDLENHARTYAESGGEGAKWYTDSFTGKTVNRPGWNRLDNDLRKGDTVVVWRLDRLGRTAKGLVNLLDDLKTRGVNFVSVRDGIDTTNGGSAVCNLLIHVLISIAQFETELRQERIAAAMEAKRQRGEPWKGGRPKGSVTKSTPTVCALVRQLRAEGKGVSEIARTLQIARNTVYAALKN